MAAKKKNGKKAPKLESVPTGTVVKMDEKERLEAYNLQLKIIALNSQLEAMQQRGIALQTELEVLPKKAQEAQEQRQALAQEYQDVYSKLKDEYKVPEGYEINLENGTVVATPAAPQ